MRREELPPPQEIWSTVVCSSGFRPYSSRVIDASPNAQFLYELDGSGWSQARVALGDQFVELSASYLTDALGDLLRAVQRLCEGATSERVSWALEPGEYRWLFRRDGHSAGVRILEFGADYFDRPADEAGREVLAGTVSLGALAKAVATGAREVLERHGESGYQEQWIEHPFPTAALRVLEAYGPIGSRLVRRRTPRRSWVFSWGSYCRVRTGRS